MTLDTMLPRSGRPQLGRHRAEEILHGLGVNLTRPCLLGVRGYFRDTLGRPGTNDRGLYDDALFVYSPHAFVAFNANTDPSREGGRLASLALGVWSYQLGTHHPGTPTAYECLVQAAPVTVHRDNGVTETGEFYIHIHRGGVTTTGSEGCQTIPPEQWDAFLALVKSEMARAGTTTIAYALQEFQG